MEGGDAGVNVGSGGDGGGAGGCGDGESSSEGESEEVLDVSFISPSSVSGEDGSPNNMLMLVGMSRGRTDPKSIVHFLAIGGGHQCCLPAAALVGVHAFGDATLVVDSHTASSDAASPSASGSLVTRGVAGSITIGSSADPGTSIAGIGSANALASSSLLAVRFAFLLPLTLVRALVVLALAMGALHPSPFFLTVLTQHLRMLQLSSGYSQGHRAGSDSSCQRTVLLGVSPFLLGEPLPLVLRLSRFRLFFSFLFSRSSLKKASLASFSACPSRPCHLPPLA